MGKFFNSPNQQPQYFRPAYTHQSASQAQYLCTSQCGRALGLDRLYQSRGEIQSGNESSITAPAQARASTLSKSTTTLRSDTLKIPLMPGQGAEIKSMMNPGDSFVFHWQVDGGAVSFDMHGERPSANGTFTSYSMGENQQEASGTFAAPFTGTHGWYWENKGDSTITVVLQTHGFYNALYMP